MASSIRISADNYCCFRPLNDNSTRMVFEITRHCNLNCIHCMAPSKKTDVQLTHERIKELMHELRFNNISKIMFTGGEPLLVNNLLEYVAIASSYGIIVDLNTNLTLLTNTMARRLKTAGVSEVTTSIDGDRDTHCKIRGDNECYDRTLKAISFLRSYNVKVDVVSMIMEATADKLNDVIETSKKLGVSSLTFSDLILKGNAREDQRVRDRQQVINKILILRNKTSFPIRTVKLVDSGFEMCHKGIDMVSIDYKGDVHPCLQSKVENPINIQNSSLKNALKHMRENISNTIGGCHI